MAEFRTLIIYFSQDDRNYLEALKESYECRTVVAALREVIIRLRAATSEDISKLSNSLRKELIKSDELANEQSPFAEGRATSFKLSEGHLSYLKCAADALGVGSSSKVVRAALRVAAAGSI